MVLVGVVQVDAVLGEECRVDRCLAPIAGEGKSSHVRDHERQDETVAPGHFKNNEDRGHRGADDAGKDGAHTHKGECADGIGGVVEDGYVEVADRAAEHGAHEQ